MDMPITHYPDIQFAPFDVLLDEGTGPDTRMDEGDSFLEFLVVQDNGCLGDSKLCFFGHRLNNQWKGKPLGPLDGPSLRYHHEIWKGDSME